MEMAIFYIILGPSSASLPSNAGIHSGTQQDIAETSSAIRIRHLAHMDMSAMYVCNMHRH
jgi:hypothetical protein